MISAQNISKRYYLYASPWEKVREMLGMTRKPRRQEFWALRDVNLTVPPGKTLGIIGANGAGKSTLLKIVTGVARPTSGSIDVKGKVAALLELGTGFHTEFTGRQNIYINGKMLGLSEDDLAIKEQEIIDFAEIGDFIDQPLRTYSSGMAMRLGFATGVAAEPDVFIIDEVLSVGDGYFAQKCHRKLEEIRNSGTSILFVSHDMSAIVRLCDEAILLNKGAIAASGTPRDIIEYYTQLIAGRSQNIVVSAPRKRINRESSIRYGNREALISNIEMFAIGRDEPGDIFVSGSRVRVKLHLLFLSEITNPTVGLLIRDRVGYDIFGTNTLWMREVTGSFKTGEQAVLNFDFDLNIGPNLYTITAAIHDDETHLEKCFDWIEQAYSFKVVDGPDFRFYGAARLIPKLEIDKDTYDSESSPGSLIAELFADAPTALTLKDSEEAFLLSGWFWEEKGDDGRTVRWTGSEALFALTPGGLTLKIQCLASGRRTPVKITLFRLIDDLGTKQLEPEQYCELSWDLTESGKAEVFRIVVDPPLPESEDESRELGILILGISSL